MPLILKIFISVVILWGLFATIVLSYDMYHTIKLWLSRIHIGRWKADSEWYSSILKRAEKWLNNPPEINLSDRTKYLLVDKINGKNYNATVQCWQIAGLILGLESAGCKFKRKDIKTIIQKYCNTHEIDRALLAYALLCLDKFYTDIDGFVSQTLAVIEKVKGDLHTIPYRKSNKTIRYVDTLGLVCPFLIKYGIYTKDLALVNLAFRQIKEFRSVFHKELLLPPHAFNISNNHPMGVYDWGRGVGWYALALVESKKCLESHVDKTELKDVYDAISELIIELSENIAIYQRGDGGFSSFVTNCNLRGESSATVLFGLLFVEAYNLNKNQQYISRTFKIITFLKSATRRNGAIDYCQGDTMDIGLYSANLDKLPFVQGLTLLLYNRYRRAIDEQIS